NLLHRSLEARPGRCEHGVALRLEALLPAFPAERLEPEAEDEDGGRHLRRRGSVGRVRGHGAPIRGRVRVLTRDYPRDSHSELRRKGSLVSNSPTSKTDLLA